MGLHKILTALNARLRVSNLFGASNFPNPTDTLEGIPLGTADGTDTGEIAVKVMNVGAGAALPLTTTSSLVTTDSTVTAGAKSIDFIFSSTFTGTVNGVTYDGSVDAVQSFAPMTGYVYPEIAYTVITGNIRIVKNV